MRKNLTYRFIRSLRPRENPYEIADSSLRGLMLRVQPTGRQTYYLQYGRGRRVRIGDAQVVTLEQARQRARSLLGEIADGADPGAQRRALKAIPTLRAFLDDSDKDSYGYWVVRNRRDGAATLARLRRCFLHDFGSLRLDAITPARVDSWRTRRLQQVTPETANRDVSALKACLARGVKWRKLPAHPLAGYEMAETDRHKRALRALTAEEVGQLREALEAREDRIREARASANAWREQRGYRKRVSLDGVYVDVLRPAVELSLETGLRRGELFSLTWDRIDLDNQMLHVAGETTKSYASREVPLNDVALAVLRRWKLQIGRPETGLVFPGANGQIGNLKRSFYRVLNDAGIQRVKAEGRISWHSLRHTFGSRLGAANVDAQTLRELMGHADIKTTQRYLHSDKRRKAAAVARLVSS